MKIRPLIKIRRAEIDDERGSLALEHVLFIGAVVALAGAIYAFYGQLDEYFEGIDLRDGESVPAPNF